MEKFIVHGYTCNYLEQQTDSTCQYRAFTSDGRPVMITEYFMQDICIRQNNGQIQIQEQSSVRFKENLFQFVEKANALINITSDILPKPLDVFYENGTAYVVWPNAEGYFWQSYMKTHGGSLSFQDRLALFEPLMHQLDQLAAQGIFYQFKDNELIIRESGALALNAMYRPNSSFADSLTSVTHLMYFALSDATFPAGNVAPALRQNVSMILTGQLPIHNFDRLYKLFKECLLFPNKVLESVAGVPPIQQTTTAPDLFSSQPTPPTTPPEKKKTIAVVVILIVSILLMVIGLSISTNAQKKFTDSIMSNISPKNTSTASASDGTATGKDTSEPVSIENEILLNTIHQDASRNGDERIAYDRTIIPYEDQLIYRYWNQGWHLRKDNGKEATILANDVFPSFLTVSDGYVYYSDAFKDHHVYRVPIGGGEPSLVLAQPVLSFGIDQDSIYYGNINKNYSLYKAPVGSSDEGTMILEMPSYDIFIDSDNNILYLTNLDMAVYQLDLTTNESQILDDQENYNVRYANHTLYVVQENSDDTTSLYAYGIDGVKKNILDHVTSYKYGVNNDYLYYTDYTTNALNRQNLKTGEHSQITTDVNAYWINGIGSDLIYWYNASNGGLVKWSKEENIVPVDSGIGTFDYQPLSSAETKQLAEEKAYGSNVTSLAGGSSVVQDAENNLYFYDFYKATGGEGIYNIYNALYRCTPEGQANKISDSGSTSLFLQDNYIYYADYQGIKRTSTDGGKTNTIAPIKTSQIYPYQDQLYFTDNEGDLFVMNLDGSEQKQLLTAEASSFLIYEDHIYFISKTDRDHIYWCDLEGLNKNPLVDMDVDSFTISNQKIYYVSENSLFNSELDGSNVKEIASLTTSIRSPKIYVYKEWIYFLSGNGLSYNVSRLRIDGSVGEPVFTDKKFSSSSFSILDDKLYFSIDDLQGDLTYTFYRSDLNGENAEKLITN